MAVVLLSVFGEPSRESPTLGISVSELDTRVRTFTLQLVLQVWLQNTSLCFTISHLEPKETLDTPLQMDLGAEPGPRWHKGEFHCSVEFTVAQRDQVNWTRKISLRETEQTLFVSFFSPAYSHVVALARTLWNLQYHKSWPQKLAKGYYLCVGCLGHCNRAHQTGIHHIPNLCFQIHSQQPCTGNVNTSCCFSAITQM